jgi:hypothetical protein
MIEKQSSALPANARNFRDTNIPAVDSRGDGIRKAFVGVNGLNF